MTTRPHFVEEQPDHSNLPGPSPERIPPPGSRSRASRKPWLRSQPIPKDQYMSGGPTFQQGHNRLKVVRDEQNLRIGSRPQEFQMPASAIPAAQDRLLQKPNQVPDERALPVRRMHARGRRSPSPAQDGRRKAHSGQVD